MPALLTTPVTEVEADETTAMARAAAAAVRWTAAKPTVGVIRAEALKERLHLDI